jgi:RimJ/RimL family protein N-acetyltransferase
LRPPEYSDVPAIVEYLSDYDIAKNLASVPHPFTVSDGRTFVTKAHERRALGEGYGFAVLDGESERFMGSCRLSLIEGRYSIAYWLGKPFWNRGIMSEAARRLLVFAFRDLKADEVWGSWFADNRASGRVLEKLGFQPVESYRRESLARGKTVACIRTVLSREEFGRKKPSVKPSREPMALAAGV